MMYAKLFSRITESSLMEEPMAVRYVFMMLLAIADQAGDVVGTDVALARRINVPIPEFQECITALMLPDPDSNSQEQEGRRIIQSEGSRGYHLVNYLTYRGLKTADDRREYMRNYMAARRGKQPVNSSKQMLTRVRHAEAEANAESEAKAKLPTGSKREAMIKPSKEELIKEVTSVLGMTSNDAQHVWNVWEENEWTRSQAGKRVPIKNWRLALSTWKTGNYFPSQKQNGSRPVDGKDRSGWTEEQIRLEKTKHMRGY